MTTDPSCPTITEPPETINRFRRGDVREDGKIFWAYKNGYGSKELWYRKEAFIKAKTRHARASRELYLACSPEERAAIHQRNKEWKKANTQRATRRANARRKERRHNDPVFAIASRFRVNLHLSLKSRGQSKNSRSSKILGCTWRDLGNHLESQFSPGMSWNNRSEWHIDHIVPLSLAKTEQDVKDLNHYLNLRPLWKKDNLVKQATLPPAELFPPHLLRFLPPETP